MNAQGLEHNLSYHVKTDMLFMDAPCQNVVDLSVAYNDNLGCTLVRHQKC